MADRFDALLAQMAQQHGGVEPLLESFFGFLHRKTDFYVVSSDPAKAKMGFLPGQAQQKVLAAFQNASAAAKEKIKPQLTEDGKQVPVGNGGVADDYTWTQTLEDVSIQMEVAQGTRAKALNCQIEATKLRVSLKSDPTRPFLEGEFFDKIRADESIWSLEGNHTLNISLEKIKPTWWASALKGGPEIDTSQVDSRRNIQEYDDVTQGAIRKAVFDQRQQQLNGVPLTPEEQMLEEAKSLPGSPFLPSTQDK
ncbi:nuclear migration protein nudC-like protein [Phytophthora infestans T30-4]|uniref:Nuclear migration protein nudC-like protein n=1 Tax=Phytophthora infestans (strain T30-4) TaxID=403677 RepID=D0MT00_PHYIT|nr:nuclear migration protein nudC-like protein [Phytophthora infestans T30-4]EEY57584.1 nuclear migration protein nudC-like protein [Phytophthora infestans T30-4]|eukprot:XP_002908770.1 nuclear migration protein nudC-like protein [Phytophthora infestans T30-4]